MAGETMAKNMVSMNDEIEDGFFTFQELQDILRIKSENTLRKALQEGEIPGSIKIRGRWRIHKKTFYKNIESVKGER